MSEQQISSARTKASSLSETGDLQGSIWQPGHWVSRLDDLEMKNANNACFLQASWQGWANLIRCFLNVSLSFYPSLILWLSLSLLATLSFPPSHLFVTLNAGWERQRWSDRNRICCLSARSGRAWRSSAFSRGVKERVTRSRNYRTCCKSVRPQSHTPSSSDPL